MTDFLVAEAGIRQLHARYTDAVWRKDYAAFGDCWTDDAEWRIGGLVLRGREEIAQAFERFMGRYQRVLFTSRTPTLEVGDGTASGRTYITEQNSLYDGSSVTSIATYYERFVEEGGRWRRAWALFQLHYLGPSDLTGVFFEQPDFGPPPNMPALDAPTSAHVRPGG